LQVPLLVGLVVDPLFRAKGTLEWADGTAWAFSTTFRALITREDEFRVVVLDIRSNCW